MNIMPDVGIPNLMTVEGAISAPPGKFIYRGGQPDNDGFKWLKDKGVTDVVKLNTEGESSDVAAEALGIRVHYMPIPLEDQLVFKPRKDLVVAATSIITTAFEVPTSVFVHCEHGQDRTGLVIGCYRVWEQGWTKDDAWTEMKKNGFHEELLGLMLFWEWVV